MLQTNFPSVPDTIEQMCKVYLGGSSMTLLSDAFYSGLELGARGKLSTFSYEFS